MLPGLYNLEDDPQERINLLENMSGCWETMTIQLEAKKII
jgi:hypothetical protein